MLATIDDPSGDKLVTTETGLELGRLSRLEDGYFYYFPTLRSGAWSEGYLLALAKLLQQVNEPYDKQVQDHLRRLDPGETIDMFQPTLIAQITGEDFNEF